jgi:sulfide:quinone oxidoreductase
MAPESPSPSKLVTIVIGGGVAAAEAVLALHELAGDRIELSMIAPGDEFIYRPMSVAEPFARGRARRYPLAPIAAQARARLISDELSFIEPSERCVRTLAGERLSYDALLLALGAKAVPRYPNAITIDDRRMDEILHGIVQDVEGGYVKSLAFLSPPRMPWQLPLYELALMAAARAYDMNMELDVTIVTPEERPLAIFGTAASEGVGELLERSHINTINSAYAEVPRPGEVLISPGERWLRVERVIALPELHGPAVRGIPLSEHGFLRTDPHGRVMDAERIFAAGDATEFPVKHGGLASQQADAAAQSIAALAGAPVTPEPFDPVIHGMLLTGERPLYLTAKISGGHGFASEVSYEPPSPNPPKIVARYLAPYLQARETEGSLS